MSLKGKIALVTGASRGIGRAIALLLGQEGAAIVGSATTQAGAAGITDYLQEAGIQGFGIILDVAYAESIEATMRRISDDIGAPHILVNNAGITADNLFLRMKEEEWTRVINTNLTGTYRLTQACLKPMLKMRWGRIVNISSVVGVTGNGGQANYAASKAGIIALTKSLARELGSRGITVNVVAPGFIETDMTRTLTEDQHKKLLEQIPLGRMGTSAEVAYVVSFLVSSRADYITGGTLHVNGGMLM